MRPRPCCLLALGLWVLTLAVAPQAQGSRGIARGRWTGRLTIKSLNQGSDPISTDVALWILDPARGALFDMPAQSMYGYPLYDVTWSGTRIHFILDALGPGEDLRCDGVFAESPLPQPGTSTGSGGSIIGTAVSTSWKGSFLLRRSDPPPVPGETLLEIPVKGGSLPGSLLLPPDGGRCPLVVLFAGAGAADRNGNNYNVPGKSDSLAQLASALAGRGVASFRFDKRGAGEAYALQKAGVVPGLDELAADGEAVLARFLGLDEYPRVMAAGMNEGAWVAAMASARIEAGGSYVDGLVAMAASGESPKQNLARMMEGLDKPIRDEAEGIVASLLAGKPIPEPSETLAGFFAPGRLSWLASWLAVDPARLFASVQAPVLFIYGGSDLQLDRTSFEKLLSSRPASAARLLPSMNYALKSIGSEKENYDSFTNPVIPVSQGLLDLLEAFAKAKPAPTDGASIPDQASR